MSDTIGDLSNTGSRISRELLFGFAFGGIGVSFSFILFRLSVRWKLFGRLFWDDGLVILAWVPFLAVTIAWWMQREGVYIIWYLIYGIKQVTPHNLDLVVNQFRLILVAQLVFTISLWSIKLSFLIFFRRLDARQRPLRIWWWIVTIFTIVTFFGLAGALPYQCATSDIQYLIYECSNGRTNYHRIVLFYTHLAADITSDILIISIPVTMFWNVRIPLKQKLGLMAIFSMTLLVIICAIIRIAVNSRYRQADQDNLWLIFWAALELSMAIIVACCGAFRQLYKSAGKSEADNSQKLGTRFSTKYISPVNWRNGLFGSNQKSILDSSPSNYAIHPRDGHDAEECMVERVKHVVEMEK